jgi:type II secretory pathway pseudopilin PulG
MADKNSYAYRPGYGFTLIEMLASALIVGFVGAGIAGLVILNGMTEIRMSNKVDNLNAARTAIERLGRDIRMARNLGDVYGAPFLLQNSPTQVWGFGGSNSFPAPNNPTYPNGSAPSGFSGWPSSPWPSAPTPGYTLSNQCLVVQVPVFDTNGFPIGLAKGFGTPPLPANEDDVDTLVYMVVPDPSSPSSNPTFMLQVAGFPGPNSTMAVLSNPPETILKGIVGPTAYPGSVSLSNPPVVFQYLDKTQGGVAQNGGTAGNGLTNVNLTGVLIQFQVLNNASGTNAPTVVGVKSEVYARNNNVQTVTATDDQLSSGS